MMEFNFRVNREACSSDEQYHHLIELAHKVDREQKEAYAQWITKLRGDGISAAHPDDGWVNRKENEVFLCYPDFNDGVAIGSKIALGNPRGYRVVGVIGLRETNLIMPMIYYQFKEENKESVEVRIP